MVYHAAHWRLLRVLSSVCQEYFTVVTGEALGFFFHLFIHFIYLFIFLQEVRSGVNFQSLISEWTQCLVVVTGISSCLNHINEPVGEQKKKTLRCRAQASRTP